MHLGSDRDADSDGAGHDEKDAEQSGNAGTEVHGRTGRAGVR